MQLHHIISLGFASPREFGKEDEALLLLEMRLYLHSGHTNSGLGAQQLPSPLPQGSVALLVGVSLCITAYISKFLYKLLQGLEPIPGLLFSPKPDVIPSTEGPEESGPVENSGSSLLR